MTIENIKTYRFGDRDVMLNIYFGPNAVRNWVFWINFSGAIEKAPFEHGIPFRLEFETQEQADDFRDKIADWLELTPLT